MITHLHDCKIKRIAEFSPSIQNILKKIVILLIPIPLFMLITGTEGIIENDSPENLATLNSLGANFFNSYEMHTLIFSGAFGITFIIWLVTRNIWKNSANRRLEDRTPEAESDSDFSRNKD